VEVIIMFDQHGSASNPADDEWVNEKALQAARMESQVFGRQPGGSTGSSRWAGPNGEGETPSQTLRRLFEENSPAAAGQIINLSAHASSEQVRLRASAYIVERVLGPIGAGMGSSGSSGADAPPGSLEHTLHEIEKNMDSSDSSRPQQRQQPPAPS
jgi:hypothetical protein